MATSTSPRRKEQAKPVTGKVRWLRPLIFGKTLGRIAITNANSETTEYERGDSGARFKPRAERLAPRSFGQPYSHHPLMRGRYHVSWLLEGHVAIRHFPRREAEMHNLLQGGSF